MTHENEEMEKKFQAIEADAAAANESPAITVKAGDKKETTVREFVEDIVNSNAILFYDQYNDDFIAYGGNGSNVSKIDSKNTKKWLANYSYITHHKVITPDTANRVIQLLSAKAQFEGEQYPLEVRCVRNAEGLWYDLGTSAVHITANNWEVTDQPPIVFRRFAHQKAQVLPTRGGDIRLLLKYINIADAPEQILFLVYVVAALIPDYPHPLLILHGSQGAGKTTPMMIMKEIIDPSALKEGFSLPKNEGDFAQIANHHFFLFFDNLSKMPETFSDTLARAATGGSFSKRGLYTDDDDIIYRFQRTIALNGINQVVYKSDLLDRSILIHLERISPDRRKEYQVFWAEFERDRPTILGAIFDVLAKAMTLYEDVKLTRLPRMADFTRWGYAIAEAAGFTGTTFIKAYNANIALQNEEAIEANPVGQVVVAFMKIRDEWAGTPSELFQVLDDLAFNLRIKDSKGWPGDTVRLSRAIGLIETNLNAIGIKTERWRTSKDRMIAFSKSTVDTDAADATSMENNSDDDSMTATSVQEQLL
jgi:hypothetical protein